MVRAGFVRGIGDFDTPGQMVDPPTESQKKQITGVVNDNRTVTPGQVPPGQSPPGHPPY